MSLDPRNTGAEKDYILEFRWITKTFPGVRALSDVTFGVKRGCVHVMVGENGAGKSTLLKVINGLYKADAGEVFFDGKPLHLGGPAEALKNGISMIYQELNTIPQMTVLENIFLGREILNSLGNVDYRTMAKQAEGYLKQQGLAFNLSAKMKTLSMAEAQMIEIVKAISVNAKVILMDEPTSSLTENEVNFLFNKIAELREAGITVIYISHKMEEVFKVGEYITVLRDGQHISTQPAKETNTAQIIEMMVGRKMTEVYPPRTSEIGETIFKVENFNRAGVFSDINFEVRKGEILGVGGLIGAGRTEIARSIMAMDHKDTGDVYIDGKKTPVRSVNDAIMSGMVLVPEDRRHQGLNLIGTVSDNVSLVSLMHIFRSWLLDLRGIRDLVRKMISYLKIRAPSPATRVEKLSGGNQQKVVLGKWLSVDPRILILDEPTRGIDVGTKYEIYKLMREKCAQGSAIILIDSDLEELMGMSDRVMVIREGRIAGFVERKDISATTIMRLAATGGTIYE